MPLWLSLDNAWVWAILGLALIGAVGISGDTGECDEACAIAGIDAAGLFHGDRK